MNTGNSINKLDSEKKGCLRLKYSTIARQVKGGRKPVVFVKAHAVVFAVVMKLNKM